MNTKDTWMNRQIQLKLASKAQLEQALQAVESQYELEDDEMNSARQKAKAILKTNNLRK